MRRYLRKREEAGREVAAVANDNTAAGDDRQ